MQIKPTATRFLIPAAGIALLLALLLLLWLMPGGKASGSPASGSGIVIMDADAYGGKREMPLVSFDHDRHYRAVKEDGKTCFACHEEAPAGAMADFGVVANTGGKEGSARKNAFHDTCIGCHSEKGFLSRSGPDAPECRACHTGAAKPDIFKPAFDKALHYTHLNSTQDTTPALRVKSLSGLESGAILSKTAEANCVTCHHLVMGLGQETAEPDKCGYCHDPGAAGGALNTAVKDMNRPLLDAAEHKRCLNCHVQNLDALGEAVGPIECAGCHDAARWAGYRRKAPQDATIYVKQPAALQLSASVHPDSDITRRGLEPRGSSMTLVYFNHGLHEKSQESCGVCHHSTVRQPCSACHTPQGDEKGAFFSLSQVTHATKAELPEERNSCVSCHNALKFERQNCSGCHSLMPMQQSAGNCAFCHKPMNELAAEDQNRLLALTGAVPFPGQVVFTDSFDIEKDVPEVVLIELISREYEGVEFKHREHVKKLMGRIEQAAPSFGAPHGKGYTACAACHHNSPASARPPRCVSCHAAELPASRMYMSNPRPLLKVAYHQQCMGCHSEMLVKEVPATDCLKCHETRMVPANR